MGHSVPEGIISRLTAKLKLPRWAILTSRLWITLYWSSGMGMHALWCNEWGFRGCLVSLPTLSYLSCFLVNSKENPQKKNKDCLSGEIQKGTGGRGRDRNVINCRKLSWHWKASNGKHQSLGDENWTQTFFLKLFGHRRHIPAKSRDIPPKEVWFPWFRGTYRTFWPPPLHVEDPYTTGKYPGSKV